VCRKDHFLGSPADFVQRLREFPRLHQMAPRIIQAGPSGLKSVPQGSFDDGWLRYDEPAMMVERVCFCTGIQAKGGKYLRITAGLGPGAGQAV
jgi:hypothetical protein